MKIEKISKKRGKLMVTRLKIERMKKRWTLEVTAKKIGTSRAWYWHIEKGSIEPSKETAKKLEETFGIKIDELLKGV